MSGFMELALSAATGGLGGALLRLIPVGLDMWNKKKELDHEFRMAQLDSDDKKYFAEHQLRIEDKAIEHTEVEKSLDAYMTALQQQMQPPSTINYVPTGNKFVDYLTIPFVVLTNLMTSTVYVISASVRPVITYAFLGMYLFVKYATYQAMLAMDQAKWYVAAKGIWTPEDVTLFSGVISFWFVGRVFERDKK